MSERAPPDCLKRHGITRVVDNLDGRDLDVPPAAIAAFFGRDVVQALQQRKRAREAAAAEARAREGR